VLGLHIPMGFWWGVAAVQSEDQYISHHKCHCHLFGKGSVNQEGFSKGAPVIRDNYWERRKVQSISHKKDDAKVVSLILLLSGDVETNPGPGNVFFCA
jgi:hypothetical protein